MHAICCAHLLFLYLITVIIFGERYKIHNAVFPILPSLHPSLAQILSYVLCSQTSSICFLPSMWEKTKDSELHGSKLFQNLVCS
jgi:hypothetical protein